MNALPLSASAPAKGLRRDELAVVVEESDW